ncbi:TrmH family RNA methyltransferase [Peptostreptococcus russellii]|uniref:TrmH family RNA methyltransferase n=1 Tax=Peptostreptococcus russellii TaxID=215200 RepID=UPI0016298A44|nr:RNA methyltransferase [Peptostreptococcus russellii]
MIFIKSKDNDKFKLAKSLLKTKYRNREKKYLAEGLRTVELALEHGAKIECVFLSERFVSNDENIDVIEKLEEVTKIYALSDDLFKNISETENSQGIVAMINMKDLVIEDYDCNRHKKIIILDRLQDPGNLGTIIRTADAAGFDMIIMTKGCVDLYNPKVVRAAMGSMFYMDIVSTSQEKAFEVLKENNVEIVSSYLKTDNFFNKVDYSERCALVLGNEANGICDFWIDNSDLLVKIPMYGKAESLNVGISAALLMYQISL